MRDIEGLSNGEKLDLFIDVMDPAFRIFSDDSVTAVARSENASLLDIAKVAIHRHHNEVVEILALYDGEDPATYNVQFFRLAGQFVSLLKMAGLQDLFTSQAQK